MKQFNVLDRNLRVHQNYLLEASAGTGKTFSIENIVVRLLVETSEERIEPFTLNAILVVTFTRAAARDLRLRIRSNINQALRLINQWLSGETGCADVPDYLVALLEEGEETAKIAKKRLQYALFTFDQAQIFTIHSFCSRMLRNHMMESDMGFQSERPGEALPPEEIMGVIRDFFRTGIRPDTYSPAQLSVYLREDPDQKKLLKAAQRGYDFVEIPSFSELHRRFSFEMEELKRSLRLDRQRLIEDFKCQYESHRNYRSGETKAETLEKAVRFASLFDKNSWDFNDLDLLIRDGLVWVLALDPKLLKSRSQPPKYLHFPQLFNLLNEKLGPTLELVADFSAIFARLASDCQQLLRRRQTEEEKFPPDELLKKLHLAIDQGVFAEGIRAKYQVAVIDEFQDTDPVQWEIFRRLFLPEDDSWSGFLYLVGDPKQSIYSFRQADIYTYLSAARALGPGHCFSLDTNYRSQASLVQALNTLFSHENAPCLIPLPGQNSHLPYHPVHSAKNSKTYSFQDAKESVHFFVADGRNFKKPTFSYIEGSILIPYIAQEIEYLTEKSGVSFSQIAVLVRDRYQALRLTDFFEARKIPYVNQRGTSLTESPALPALIDLIRAVMNPRDRSAVKTAAGGPLIGWTHSDIREPERMEGILLPIIYLRQCLTEDGVSRFFDEFMQSRWLPDGLTVQERLLSREGGIEFYHDLRQLIDIVVDSCHRDWSGPEGLVPFLDGLHQWEANEDPRVKRFQDPSKNGVKILTLHVSKGLEFDIVFALGLVNRSGMKESLIPIEKDGKIVLSPVLDDRKAHALYFEEGDAEKMRQLYVAMTRAKHRLYVPAILSGECSALESGEASPIDLFLAKLGREPAVYSRIYERINAPYDGLFTRFLDSVGIDNHISYSVHQKIVLGTVEKRITGGVDNLERPRTVSVLNDPIMISSFSAMSSLVSSVAYDEGKSVPHDFECDEKTVHTLPSCAETGTLLHLLLDEMSFSELNQELDSTSSPRYPELYIWDPRFKPWGKTISRLILNTLMTPLSAEDPSFFLANLDPSCMYKEMSFMFPSSGLDHSDELQVSDGFIRGIVDLIFLWQGKYYIVDWKSNWLGPRSEDYSHNALQKSMSENGYFLQGSIYTEALGRYLRLVDPRPFDDCFGGVFYLFMRGMSPGHATGIYHFMPKPFHGKTVW